MFVGVLSIQVMLVMLLLANQIFTLFSYTDN